MPKQSVQTFMPKSQHWMLVITPDMPKNLPNEAHLLALSINFLVHSLPNIKTKLLNFEGDFEY
jgi:hypothetical protein